MMLLAQCFFDQYSPAFILLAHPLNEPAGELYADRDFYEVGVFEGARHG
jgi:hypothetical protein